MSVRQIRIEGDVAYVPLTKGYEAVIDAADVPLVEVFNWYAFIIPTGVYAARSQRCDGRVGKVLMHRVITIPANGKVVDHIDGNGLNNCRSNLRIATPSENSHNSRRPSSNRSGFKGVHWDRYSRKWRAKIVVSARFHHLGYFETAEAAWAARCAAALSLHGQFARLA